MNTKSRLLVAEDEPELRNLLDKTLSEAGFSVITAENGQQMLDLLLNDPEIAAVLSDLNMPVMTGMEVLKRIREKKIEVPVVFLTAYGDKKAVMEALKLGAFDFLEKPYSEDLMVKTVRQAMALGVRLKTLEQEMNNLSTKYGITDKDRETFESLQRPVLLMKMKNRAFTERSE